LLVNIRPQAHEQWSRAHHSSARVSDARDPAGPESKNPFLEVAGVIENFSTWSLEEKNIPIFFIPAGRVTRKMESSRGT
jgi:hypothetical protein